MLFRLVWVLGCVGTAAGGYLALERFGPRPATVGAQTPPVAVEAADARVVERGGVLLFVGSLDAVQSVWVSPVVSGHVAAVDVADGQRVERGDVLYRLDDRVARAELSSAQAQLTLDLSRLERDASLERSGLLPAESLEASQAQAEQSRNTVAIKTMNLRLLTIQAPFAGTLGRHLVDAGQYVGPGDRLVRLTDLTRFTAEFRVPERYLEDIAPGAVTTFSSTALSGSVFTGAVSFIDPSIDPETRSFLVRAAIASPRGRLRPGLFGRVGVRVGEPRPMVVVPDSAIVYQLTGTYVFVVENGVARLRPVEIGGRHEDVIEIVRGLAAGDTVVTAGQFEVRDGTALRITPGGSPPGAAGGSVAGRS